MRFLFVSAAVAALVVACSSSGSDTSSSGGTTSSGGGGGTSTSSSGGATISNPPPANPFDALVSATRVVIEIDYAENAEPFTGNQLLFGDPWDLFKTNAAKLFEGTGKTVEVPTSLDKMEKLTGITAKMFDSDAILALANAHRGTKTEGDHVAYYVIWLDGTYVEGGVENKNVLGVTIGNTGVIAMFKPVIKSAGPTLGDSLVEQTVLVHEFGHGVGLVNNGVPLASQHQDTAHGAHCSNTECVMYWSVDGNNAARDFVQRKVTKGSDVLFADDCIADIRASGAKK